MQTFHSRMQSQKDQKAKRNATILFVGSAVALVLIIIFGIKLVFALTGAISSFRGSTEEERRDELNFIPSRPAFNQELTATRSAQFILSGVADKGISVEVTHNNRTLGIFQADEAGKFTLDVDLEKGKNSFGATAVSSRGQKSDPSEIYDLIFASKPPKIEEISPKDGDTVKESLAAVKGKTNDDTVTVTINDHLAIVQADGTFSAPFSLREGENKIKIVARDAALNETVKEITLKFQP